MAKMSPDRLEKYRRLADRGLWDVKDQEVASFYRRAAAEGVKFGSNDFSTLGMFRAPHRKDLAGVDLAIVGNPMDIGVPNPRPGTRLGPREMRYWSLDRDVTHYRTKTNPFELCAIVDWGDVEFTDDSYNLASNLRELAALYSTFKEADVVPFTVGGEHTGTYAVFQALSRDEPLGVIHIDAHSDTSVGFGGSRISDASLMQVAAVEGYIDPERTIQIGLRGRGVIRADFSYDSGMRVVLADEVQEKGVAAVVAEARRVVGDGPCYLTFDTDAIDCSEMPGTTLPEPFGLTGREARDLIRGLRGLDIVGADIVELSPPYDPTGQSACLASGLAFEMLCVVAEARAARTGVRRKTHWS